MKSQATLQRMRAQQHNVVADLCKKGFLMQFHQAKGEHFLWCTNKSKEKPGIIAILLLLMMHTRQQSVQTKTHLLLRPGLPDKRSLSGLLEFSWCMIDCELRSFTSLSCCDMHGNLLNEKYVIILIWSWACKVLFSIFSKYGANFIRI